MLGILTGSILLVGTLLGLLLWGLVFRQTTISSVVVLGAVSCCYTACAPVIAFPIAIPEPMLLPEDINKGSLSEDCDIPSAVEKIVSFVLSE